MAFLLNCVHCFSGWSPQYNIAHGHYLPPTHLPTTSVTSAPGDRSNRMRKRNALVVGVFLLSAWPLNAGKRLTMGVSPAVAFAPATVRVRATVEVNPENRAIQIVAESPEFYRSSEISLD